MKSTYYVASSLDGFIADDSGGVEWLDQVDIDANESTYDQFYAGIDGLMMGRATYDFVYDYGTWPYVDQPCWVITSSAVEPLPGCNLQSPNNVQSAWDDASNQGVEHLWVVGGGKLASSLIQMNLLSHIQVTVMPVMLGRGIPLVDVMPEPSFLQQERVVQGVKTCEIVYRLDAERADKVALDVDSDKT